MPAPWGMFDRLLSACPAATLCYILTLLCGGLQLLYSMNYGLALEAVGHIVPVSELREQHRSSRQLPAPPSIAGQV